MAASPDVPNRGNARRWCVPPAILNEPHETLEGLRLLHEVEAHPGVLLWKALRDVTLWACTPPGERAGLFQQHAGAVRRREIGSAEIDPRRRGTLRVLAGLLEGPERVDAGAVAGACLALADALAERGARQAAVSFAQTGALAHPADPTTALRTAEYARQAGSLARALTWAQRALGLARRHDCGEVYTAALVELGDVHRLRGDAPRARRYYVRAIRSCKRHTIHAPLRGRAYHGLFRLARDAGDQEQTRWLAHQARRGYGSQPSSPLHELTHEVAAWRLETGSPQRAVALLRELYPLRADPRARLESLILLAQAAAAAREHDVFHAAWPEAWALIRQAGEAQVPQAWTAALGEAAAVLLRPGPAVPDPQSQHSRPAAQGRQQ